METYQCALCGGTFEKGRSDEDAVAEAKKLFGVDNANTDPSMLVICDPCFQTEMSTIKMAGMKNWILFDTDDYELCCQMFEHLQEQFPGLVIIMTEHPTNFQVSFISEEINMDLVEEVKRFYVSRFF